MEQTLDLMLLGDPLRDWLAALGILLVVNTAALVLLRVARGRLTQLAKRTASTADDAVVRIIDRTHRGLVFVLSLYVASRSLDLPDTADRAFYVAALGAGALQAGRWANAALDVVLERYRQRSLSTDAGAATAMSIVGFAVRVVVWSLLLLLVLDNLGIDVTAMVAGLGIGGIAVALAVQNILGDLLASVSIIADRPFVVGDFIIVDDYMGTVEHVGLKTTHVRSLGGEQIIFANNDLLKTRVRNYKRMYERRVVFTFGLRYGTTPDQLDWVAQQLREMIGNEPKLRLERAHFFKFGESSLDFEVAYWVKDADYGVYMDLQQDLNLRLMRLLDAKNIAFAYPVRELVLPNASQADAHYTDPRVRRDDAPTHRNGNGNGQGRNPAHASGDAGC